MFFIKGGIYCRFETTQEECARVSMMIMRHQLMSWYKDRMRECPGENLTRLSHLNVKMVGTATSPTMKTKGAEAYGFLIFLLDMLNKNLTQFESRRRSTAQLLITAGEALVRMITIMKRGLRILARKLKRTFPMYMVSGALFRV